MLEVQRFDDDTWKQFLEEDNTSYDSEDTTSSSSEEISWIGKFVHVGYMKQRFITKNAAAAYYDAHNPHLRPLMAHSTGVSDWDPNTRLRYIPRLAHGARMTVPSFE